MLAVKTQHMPPAHPSHSPTTCERTAGSREALRTPVQIKRFPISAFKGEEIKEQSSTYLTFF